MAEITMNKMKIRNLERIFVTRQKLISLIYKDFLFINKEMMNKSIEIRTKVINIQLTERNYK